MIDRIAEALLVHVYYRVSAVITVFADGRLDSVRLFDTMFGKPDLSVLMPGTEVFLLSNHPEGLEFPYRQDVENYRCLKQSDGCKGVRFFIVSEYFAAREIALSSHDGVWYNSEKSMEDGY